MDKKKIKLLSQNYLKEVNFMSSIYPLELELGSYKSLYPDLKNMSDQELINHYYAFGRSEGRYGNLLKTRKDFSELISYHGKVLEIGPFVNPAVTGGNIDYADYLSTDELVKRAKLINFDPRGVPKIKYVLKDISLGDIAEDYDSVVSSHCIEHQPNLIGHLCDVQKLLMNKKGSYFLFIPDKRYCFDRHMNVSTIAEIIDAHESNRSIHTLKSLIEHRTFLTHNDSSLHWATMNDNIAQKINLDSIKGAIQEFKESKDLYIDVHAWYFTPKSFENIINMLSELNYINLKINKIYPTRKNANEFWAILSI